MTRLVLILTFVTLACTTSTAPIGAIRLVPPVNFEMLWAQTEQCAHVHGDFASVTWFLVPSTPIYQHNFPCEASPNGSCRGLWMPPHDVYLTADALADSLPGITEQLTSQDTLVVDTIPAWWIIRHEMLHDLLQQAAHGPAFQACGLIR